MIHNMLSQSEIVALLEQVRQQDQAALAELYNQYSRLVYNMALRVLSQPEQAEEVTQDVFIKLWKNPDTWDESKGLFSSWLISVTRFSAIDRLRHERRQPELMSPTAYTIGENAQFDEPQWDDKQLLQRLISELPKAQRQAILLAYFRGMTHDEIAEHLGEPVGTIKSRIRLGLNRIRQNWQTSVEFDE